MGYTRWIHFMVFAGRGRCVKTLRRHVRGLSHCFMIYDRQALFVICQRRGPRKLRSATERRRRWFAVWTGQKTANSKNGLTSRPISRVLTRRTHKKNTVISRTCYEFKNRDDQGGNLRPDMIDTCANGSYQDGRIRHEGPEICVKGRRRNLTSNCQIERRFTIACTILRPLLYPTVAFNRRHSW